jgi:hypothetical protein
MQQAELVIQLVLQCYVKYYNLRGNILNGSWHEAEVTD